MDLPNATFRRNKKKKKMGIGRYADEIKKKNEKKKIFDERNSI